MFELLSGEPLFGEGDTLVLLDKVMNEPIPPIRSIISDVPEEVERILGRALERDLEKRYQTAREMGDDLEHYMYDKGYGPTNLVLADHLAELFPDRVRR